MGGQLIAATIDSPAATADLTVARARAGDVSAFEALYRRHVGRVYALCLRMTSEPARAEDHTQETFVRAWQKLDSYRGESAFVTWLSRVAVNVVRGDRRSQLSRQGLERPLSGDHEPSTSGRRGDAVDLERAIGRLPEGARDVFVLHDIEGYRHEEIAGLLEVTVGTSKSQLHRARRLLREALNS